MSIAISTHLSRVLKQQKPTRNEVNGMELAERKKKILSAVIESYINTGEPIGSKALINETGLEVSSATVRNDLADLTNKGYLVHVDCCNDGILKLPYFREVSHPFFTTHLKFSFPAPISK